MARGFWWFIRPTWIKMFLFFLFIFALPAYLKVCSNSCMWQLQTYAGMALWSNKANGQLTFPMLIGLMIIAYLLSAIIFALFDTLGRLIKKKLDNVEKEGF